VRVALAVFLVELRSTSIDSKTSLAISHEIVATGIDASLTLSDDTSHAPSVNTAYNAIITSSLQLQLNRYKRQQVNELGQVRLEVALKTLQRGKVFNGSRN